MNPPADWYPDPTANHEQRYWDGAQWTEHVFTDGVQGVDVLEAADTGPDEPGDDTAGDSSSTVSEVSPSADAGPAFAAAYVEETPSARTPDDDEEADLWQPAGETTSDSRDEGSLDEQPDADEESVDASVDAEDVVASLEEVEAPTADATVGAGFEDAFVLSPETASRLVGQRAVETPEVETPEVETEATPEADEPDTDEPDVGPAAELADAPPPSSGVIDAPPPTEAPMFAAAPSAGLGITGDLVSGAFSEREGDGPVALQNVRLLRCRIEAGSGVVARQGTMVAYQGDISFERQGAGGVGRALKRAATGEGLAMMRVEGRGDVFFADDAQHVFLLELDGAGPGISVNGRNVLAFSASLNWGIERVKGASLLAGGLFNTTLTGSGWAALVADGEPVVLRTDEALTYVDVNALVAWSGGLSTRVVNQVSAKSLVGLGSGEAFQMAFDGAGIVIVQPSEGAMHGAAAT
jgi:uncharacterized protein (AIM24 family)